MVQPFSWIHSRSHNQAPRLFGRAGTVGATLAETGTFGSTCNMPIGNSFIPVASCVEGNPTIVLLLVKRRFVELVPCHSDFDTSTQQATSGMQSALAFGWVYDTHCGCGNADQTADAAQLGRTIR